MVGIRATKISLYDVGYTRDMIIGTAILTPPVINLLYLLIHGFDSFISFPAIITALLNIAISIYLWINTKEKLILANFYIGIQLVISAFLFLALFHITMKYSLIFLTLYFLIPIALGFLIYGTKKFAFKSSRMKQRPYPFVGMAIGTAIGRAIADYYKGTLIGNAIFLIFFFGLILLMMYFGTSLICKYIYIKKNKGTKAYYIEFYKC